MTTLPIGQYEGTAYYSHDGVRKWRVWFIENGTKAWVLGWLGQFNIPEYKELPIQSATEEELNALADAPRISDPWYIINKMKEIPSEELPSVVPKIIISGIILAIIVSMLWKR